jgi:hypothetical protein
LIHTSAKKEKRKKKKEGKVSALWQSLDWIVSPAWID